MKAGELLTLLEHQDPDLLVVIPSVGGPLVHPTVVTRHRAHGDMPARLSLTVPSAGHKNPAPYPHTDPSTIWLAPDPGFTLAGQWRRPDLLLARLDPDIPLGAPA